MRQCLVCGNPFDAPPGRGRPPETCSVKCTTLRRRLQRAQSRERATHRPIPPHVHGTSTGSTYYMCTCALCRKWSREYQQDRRAQQKQEAT